MSAADTDHPEPAIDTDQPEPAADKMDESLVDSMSQLHFKPSQTDNRQEVPTRESFMQEPAEQPGELSFLSGNTSPSHFNMKTEAQDHKSRRVRIEMGIFKAKMKAGITAKEEAQYLSTLAEYYEWMYNENTNNWAARLRAHSLYISCSLRDGSMQSKYAKTAIRVMKSSLSEESLTDLTNHNKKELEDMRQNHKAQLAAIKSKFLPTIDDENLDNNHTFMVEFAQQAQIFSSGVTIDVKKFISKLVDQSVTSIGSLPPCGIAFVALGSLARSETTPYSDVEYFFLVEQTNSLNEEYFRNLAYHTYFVIGNLGETNLKTMNIPELTNIGFQDKFPKGMRIDGLGSKAGNIPTGNGVDPSSELIFTVEELVKRYGLLLEGKFEGTDKGVGGDLADMLAHRTLVWYHGNGKHLVDSLNEQLSAIPHPDKRRSRSSSILQEDLHKYNFLPSLSASHTHQDVKSDIYRYPSLLVTGWNNAFDLKTENNWKALRKLLLDGKLNQEGFDQIAFLLASAIFIRIDAYLFYNSQTDRITLWKTTGDVGSPYTCPRSLFLLMMCYLIPLKSFHAVARHMSKPFNLVFDPISAICMTHIYCSAPKKVVKLFIDKFGEQQIFQETELFLQQINEDQLNLFLVSAGSYGYQNERCLQLLNTVCRKRPDFDYYIRSLLHLRTDPEQALREVECLSQKVLYPTEKISVLGIEVQCLIALRRFVDAEKRLRDRLSYFKNIAESDRICREQILICEAEHNELMGQLHSAKTNYQEAKDFFKEALGLRREAYGTAVIHGSINECILGIGMMCFHLQEYQESLTFLETCIRMESALNGAESDSCCKAKALQFIGSCYSRMKQKKAETMLKRSYDMLSTVYGEGSKHPNLLTCMTQIASHHYANGHYSKSLECWMGVLKDKIEAKFQDNAGLAHATFSIGLCNFCLQDFRRAWDYFDDSLGYYKEIGDFSRGANKIIIELKICEENF